MPKQENKRTITVECLGIMSKEETLDILATYIAKKIHEQRHTENSNENV